MKKIVLATLLAFAVPAIAQTAPAAPEAAPAAAEAPPPLTTNIGLVSDYRFRGIDQTYGKPALQGGFDYAHASGFYVGNWNSNIQAGAGYPGGNLEMDFYGGYKHAFGDFGIDVGAYYYYYPGTDSAAGRIGAPVNNRTGKVATGHVDNTELYIGGSWKFLSLKYSQSVGDYFSTPGTRNSGYLDLSANYDLGDGWGLNGHVGHLNFRNMSDANYTDWKLGVTKDLSGWVVGLSYVDTNASGNCSKGEFYCFSNSGGTSTRDAGKGVAVVSVSRTF